MWISVELSFSHARLRKDPQPDNSGGCEKGCGFAHVATLPSMRPAYDVSRAALPYPIARAIGRRKAVSPVKEVGRDKTIGR
jgi:hypothetical protein